MKSISSEGDILPSSLFGCSVRSPYFMQVLRQPGTGHAAHTKLLVRRTGFLHDLQQHTAHSTQVSPSQSIKGHSFCIGAASTRAAAGLPDWLIKVFGRWSSDCYQLCIRTPQQVLLSTAPQLAWFAWGDTLLRSDFLKLCSMGSI